MAQHLYDLVILLDPSATDEQRAKILADSEKIISDKGAEIVSKHDWGIRRMAFEIRHKTDAEYHLLQFNGEPEVPGALDHMLRITDGVTRFRIIKVAPGTPGPPDLRAPVVPEGLEPEAPAEPEAPVRL
jgi:small subunit ribosomal protein S6